MKLVACLMFATFVAQIFAYDPVFGQQFTTYMSSSFGSFNYTYYFDFSAQQERTDFPGDTNTSVTIMDHNANVAYAFCIVNGEPQECYVYTQYVPMEKFTFPTGLLYWGSTTVNDIPSYEYIQPGIPPVNKFYVSQDTPVKPVRQYYPPGFDAPEFQTDYYTFNYSVPADIFTPPEVCK